MYRAPYASLPVILLTIFFCQLANLEGFVYGIYKKIKWLSLFTCQPAPPFSFPFHLPFLPLPTTRSLHRVYLPYKSPPHCIPEASIKMLPVYVPHGQWAFRIFPSKNKLITKQTQNKTVDVNCKDESL